MKRGILVLIAVAACAPSPHDSPAAAPDIATSACAAADARRAEGEELFGDGRLVRGVAALELAREQCPAVMGDAWAELVEGLVDLGRYEQARREGKAVADSADATPGARRRAAAAAARAVELDRPFEESLAAKEPMLALLDRGLQALDAGRAADAQALFVEAWKSYRPNGQALAWAGAAALALGHEAEAHRLYDRAWVELERGFGERARGYVATSDEISGGWWASLVWSADARWLEVSQSPIHLAIHRVPTGERTLALEGYFATSRERPWTAWAPIGADDSDVLVLHVPSGHILARLPGSTGTGSAARPSRLLFVGDRLLVVDDEGVARLFDVRTERELGRAAFRRHAAPTWRGALLLDTDRIMTRDADRGVLHAFDADTLQPRWQLETQPIADAAVSPDGNRVAVAFEHGSVALLDAATGKERARLSGAEDASQLAWSRNGKRLFVSGNHRGASRAWAALWDAEAPAKLAGTELAGDWLRWSELTDGTFAVWATSATGLLVDGPRVLGTSSVALDVVARIAEGGSRSPEAGGWASLSGNRRTLRVETTNGAREHRLVDALGVSGMCSSGGGELVITHGVGATRWALGGAPRSAAMMQGAPSGLLWAACARNGRVAAWNEHDLYVADGTAPMQKLAPAEALHAAWSSDGKVLAILGRDGLVAWDVDRRTELFRASSDAPGAPVKIADGRFAAYWFTPLGPVLFMLPVPFPFPQDVGEAVAASADGRRVAIGPRLRVFDAPSAAPLTGVEPDPVDAVVLSPSGTLVAARRVQLPWKLWRVGQEKPLGEIGTGLTDHALAFPWEDMFALVSAPGPVRIWTAAAGRQVGELHLVGPTSAVLIAPNGDVELFGDDARTRVRCRVGPVVLPFDVCAERIEAKGLLDRGPSP